MKREELIAPEKYNLISEVERYTKDSKQVALKWESEAGEIKQITYVDLLKRVNQAGNVFAESGLKKVMLFWSWCLVLLRHILFI